MPTSNRSCTAPAPSTTDIDDFERRLGPPERRYFGQGYRRVAYAVTDLAPADAGAAPLVLLGSGSVTYPGDWSQKGSGDRVPHLSTIDAMVLSARLIEAYLMVRHGLSEQELGRAWVEQVSVRAGAKPVQTMDQVPLQCTVTAIAAVDSATIRTSLENRVGSLVVATTVRHEHGHRERSRLWAEAVAALGAPGAQTELFRDARHTTRITALDPDGGRLECEHRVIADGTRTAYGLESAYWPSVSLVDCLVLAGQMAQVLIYAADGVDRDTTGTLWMRRASFVVPQPHRPGAAPAPSTLHITARRQVPHEGRVLHSVDVQNANLFGVRIASSLAYYDTAD